MLVFTAHRVAGAPAGPRFHEKTMSDQVNPIKILREAIEQERRAWDALQHTPHGQAQDRQSLYAAWAHAVSSANREAERYVKASRPGRQNGSDGARRRFVD
jgi:hypothetical protein